MRVDSKTVISTKAKGVFLIPDWTKGERIERRKLVEALKKKRDAEPSSKFFIRRGEVVSTNK